MSSAENVVGTVELHATARLVFSVQPWQGRMLASVRKFVSTAKYEGPTKSGFTMAGEVLVSVVEALLRLQSHIPGNQEKVFAKIAKRGEVEIVVTVIPPGALNTLPSIDVREHLDTPGYTGPTKKGIRFGWEKLPEVVALMQIQAQRLGAHSKGQPTLFPDAEPKWIDTAAKVGDKQGEGVPTRPGTRDAILAELLPDGPKRFPQGFLDNQAHKTRPIQLPSEPIEVVQLPDGRYVVRSDFGFCHGVRNPTEGNFLLYAHLRGERTVHLPEEMIVIFRAVKGYENYLRELRHSLLQAYERASGYRPAAEHQAREVFKSRGLPWL